MVFIICGVFAILAGAGGGIYYYYNIYQSQEQSEQPKLASAAAKVDPQPAAVAKVLNENSPQEVKELPPAAPTPSEVAKTPPAFEKNSDSKAVDRSTAIEIKVAKPKPSKTFPVKFFHVDGSLARTEKFGSETEAQQALAEWKGAIAGVKCKGVQLCTITGSSACPAEKPYYAIVMQQGVANSAGCYQSHADAERAIMADAERLGVISKPNNSLSPTTQKQPDAHQIPNPIKALQDALNKPEQALACSGVVVKFKQPLFGAVLERRCYPDEASAQAASARWDKDSVLIEPDGSENTKYLVKPSSSPISGH